MTTNTNLEGYPHSDEHLRDFLRQFKDMKRKLQQTLHRKTNEAPRPKSHA